jgi:imidazolonepropionase-like amidohydrolase
MMRIRAGQKHSRRDFYMGRLLRRVALPLLLARGVALGQARARPDGSHPADDLPLSLMHVTVIDATGTPAQPDMTVIISGGRITALGPAAKIAVPAGSHVVDATGKFLIPGLWDMHIHIDDGEFYAGNKPYATYPSQRDKEAVFPLLIANGITGVRDMSGGLEQIQQWRTRISLGDELGPRMFTPGPMVDGKFPAWPGVLRVESEAEARDAVRSLVRRGADFIKVYDSISPADYFALADEAKRLGMTFAGHVPGQLSSAQASDAGQKSLEHMYNLPLDCSTREDEFRKEIAAKYDDPKAELPQLSSGNADVIASFSGQKCAALFDRFKRNGTWLCPTLHNSWRHAHNADSALTTDRRARFYPPAFRQFWAGKAGDARRRTPAFVAGWNRYYTAVRAMIADLRRAGVGLLAGSDAGANEYSVPGFSLHDELVELVEAGLTPMEALQTATLNPARYLGITDALGTVELGKIADLVLLEANPLEDIRNTQKIAAVVVNGSILGKPELQQIFARALQNNSKTR